jgi:NAD(P)H dehydrogenase (quinone)
MTRIMVTGATGGLGSTVANHLLRLAPESLLAVSVRQSEAARSLSDRGVAVRQGDFDIPSTLAAAFDGAERLLIVSTRGGNDERIRQHRNAIGAAVSAGVARIYYTSIVQRSGSAFAVAEGHLQTEQDLAGCGVSYTVFRNGQYMENLPMFLGWGLVGDRLELPRDGPTTWVSRLDLAEGIARIMLAPEDEPSRSLTLTGPEAIDFARVAAIAGSVLGRSIERTIISGDEFVERLVRKGLPIGLALMFESGFRSRARGELGLVSPELEDIIGRPLRTVANELPRLLAQTAKQVASRSQSQ